MIYYIAALVPFDLKKPQKPLPFVTFLAKTNQIIFVKEKGTLLSYSSNHLFKFFY